MKLPELIHKQYCLLEDIEKLSLQDWTQLVRVLRFKGLVASFYHRLQATNNDKYIPVQAISMFQSAVTFADAQQFQVQVQLRKLSKLFEQHDVTFVVLKGAAYVAGDTPNSRGRLMNDIDIIVHQEDLKKVENALIGVGWKAKDLDDYDDKYYRQWSHELPPYTHSADGVTLDIHHTFLPPVSGKLITIEPLFEKAVYTAYGVYCPTPEWMIFHSAVHLLDNDDVENGLRDLTDIFILLSANSGTIHKDVAALFVANGFNDELIYLAHLLAVFFNYKGLIPYVDTKQQRLSVIQTWRLGVYVKALVPQVACIKGSEYRVARLCSLVMGHLVKMPLSILVKHTLFKAWRGVVKAIFGQYYYRK